MKKYDLFLMLAVLVASCSNTEPPPKWNEFNLLKENIIKIESESDSNGFYADYKNISRETLMDKITKSLEEKGYKKVSEVLNGAVLGFERNGEQLAMKVDSSGDIQHLSIFNEKGIDPMLHGVCFGKYKLDEPISEEKAKEMLLKELEEN